MYLYLHFYDPHIFWTSIQVCPTTQLILFLFLQIYFIYNLSHITELGHLPACTLNCYYMERMFIFKVKNTTKKNHENLTVRWDGGRSQLLRLSVFFDDSPQQPLKTTVLKGIPNINLPRPHLHQVGALLYIQIFQCPWEYC